MEYVIRPLVIGANETDQGIMTYLRGYGKRIWIPIYSFVIEGGKERILVDTGLEQFVVPESVGLEYGLDILEFEEALDTVGLKPATPGSSCSRPNTIFSRIPIPSTTAIIPIFWTGLMWNASKGMCIFGMASISFFLPATLQGGSRSRYRPLQVVPSSRDSAATR